MLLLCLIIHYNIYTSNNGIHVIGNDNTSTHRVMKEEDHIPCARMALAMDLTKVMFSLPQMSAILLLMVDVPERMLKMHGLDGWTATSATGGCISQAVVFKRLSKAVSCTLQ